jgi:Xaa-Pro aminopeptidase
MALPSSVDFSTHALRRKDLLNLIQEKYPKVDGTLMLIAGFEHDRARFWQESSFYYYTGIVDAALVCMQDIGGQSTIYIPNCGGVREQWIHSPIPVTQKNAKKLAIDIVTELGDRCAGYQLFPFFKHENYSNVIARLRELIKKNGKVFTLYPANEHQYVEQRLVINHLVELIPNLKQHIIDISEIVADMRRSKDMHEIDLLYKAINITELAQEAAANAIQEDMLECEVQASLEYMFMGAGSRAAFPSIVATGKNATVLHYNENSSPLKNGELVVVDIGAAYQGYCADITRTYPVSGTFTKRQLELYTIVLKTQAHIANIAAPGFYLNNPEYPEKSLQHLAKAFLEKHKMAEYFVHGIGHYLGLDVHDVGNPREPLRENDIITIEPGIYIPQESIGIRIEDNYWITKKGAICLSENIVKDPKAIEELVQQSFDEGDELHGESCGEQGSDFACQETEH